MPRLRGPVGFGTFTSADVSAPGVGSLIKIIQLSNTALSALLFSPTEDAIEGTALSGINGVTVGLCLPNSDGTCPAVDDASFDASVIRSSKVEAEVLTGGTEVSVTVPIPEVGVAYYLVWQFWEGSE